MNRELKSPRNDPARDLRVFSWDLTNLAPDKSERIQENNASMVPLRRRPSCCDRQLNRSYVWMFNSDSDMAAINDKNGRDDLVGVLCAVPGRTKEYGNKGKTRGDADRL
jgi:hypothetical protein